MARVRPRSSLPPPGPPTGHGWRRNSNARWPASRPESATALARGSAVGNHRGRESLMVGSLRPRSVAGRRSPVARRRRALRRGRAGRGTMIARGRARPVSRGRIAGVVAMTMLDVGADVSGSVDRRIWLRVLAGLLGLFWGFFFYGLIDLLAFAQGEQFHAALVLSTGWGLLFLFLVAAPLVALAVRASAVSPSALAEVALVAAAVIMAAALSSSPRYLSVAAGLVVTVAVLALAARDRPAPLSCHRGQRRMARRAQLHQPRLHDHSLRDPGPLSLPKQTKRKRSASSSRPETPSPSPTR